MAGLIELVLERDGHDQPWGFRLQGGVDLAMPLSVQRVLVGTPADGTLHKGDVITRISCTETKNITHQQAADLFNNAGNQIAVQIKRAGVQASPAAATSASPLVNGSPASVPVSAGISSNPSARPENPAVRSLPKTHFVLKSDLPRPQKQSTASMETLSIQSQVAGTLQQIQQSQQTLNTAAQQQASNPSLVNKQYNSPLPLYSQENVQEAMRMQASPSHTPTINPSPTPANKPVQVILTPSKEYNPQSSATWRALQETDAPIDPEKVANYTALKEHDPIYSEVYTAPVALKPGQRPAPRTNALPGPRSPVSELLPSPTRPTAEAATDSATPSFLSPTKTGPSAVLAATLAESKPVDQRPTTDRFKIPLYETNAISGRKKIAQTATFNKLMMDVLGE
ncbi:PDZ and LIM domain protein 3-like isoform X8 [Panulirus ornatus]|uniref:PDZ and LIM domain protein 3-like isoform X8 n=1 Tax=Panulirus ornatus TaxID=150431 RepID=UPI003A877A7B